MPEQESGKVRKRESGKAGRRESGKLAEREAGFAPVPAIQDIVNRAFTFTHLRSPPTFCAMACSHELTTAPRQQSYWR